MQKLALLLFSLCLVTFSACNKEETPKTMEEQIAACEFESTGTFSVNDRSISNVGLFKLTDAIDKSKIISISLYACEGSELHLVLIAGFGVLENGTYNLSPTSDVSLIYSSSDVASVAQGSLTGGEAESGTITITDNSVSFDVVAENAFTYSNITLKGQGSF